MVEPSLERYRAYKAWVQMEAERSRAEGCKPSDALEAAEKEAEKRIPERVRRRADAVASLAAIISATSLFAIAVSGAAALFTLDTVFIKVCYAAGILVLAMTLLFIAVQPVPRLWFMNSEEYEAHRAKGKAEEAGTVPGKHRKERS